MVASGAARVPGFVSDPAGSTWMSSVEAERSRAANLQISIDVTFIVCGFVQDFGADRENFQPQMDANKRKCKFWDPAGLVFIHVYLRLFAVLYVPCGS